MSLRIGTGVDAHAFEDGVPLVLGGVRFESPRGLAGHSDGDVITHALIDAVLGAAGLGKPVRELYPHPEFLAACRARDVPVTLASDAHTPDVVGRDFDRALELLRAAGYETVTVFDQRNGHQEPLG